MFLYVSFISFHSKKSKTPWKIFPGFQARYGCYTKCGSRSPGKLRSQAWVFCCVPHGCFPWPTFVERRFTSKKTSKKNKWIQNVILKWFKNVIFQNSLLEVCLLSLSHLQMFKNLSSQRAVRVGQERWPGSQELAKDWDFQSHPSRVLSALETTLNVWQQTTPKKKVKTENSRWFWGGWWATHFLTRKTGETQFKLQSEEF